MKNHSNNNIASNSRTTARRSSSTLSTWALQDCRLHRAGTGLQTSATCHPALLQPWLLQQLPQAHHNSQTAVGCSRCRQAETQGVQSGSITCSSNQVTIVLKAWQLLLGPRADNSCSWQGVYRYPAAERSLQQPHTFSGASHC
jgi:hypothetical protein